MSGAVEVAGLALAVLPVLMSAAQQYNNCCFIPFVRYKRFAKEAKIYCKELAIQKTIFYNQCRNLLEEVVDHDEASSMLKTLQLETWANKRLDEQLAGQLGESLKSCTDIIDLIEERVREINGESQKYSQIIEDEKQVVNILHALTFLRPANNVCE